MPFDKPWRWADKELVRNQQQRKFEETALATDDERQRRFFGQDAADPGNRFWQGTDPTPQRQGNAFTDMVGKAMKPLGWAKENIGEPIGGDVLGALTDDKGHFSISPKGVLKAEIAANPISRIVSDVWGGDKPYSTGKDEYQRFRASDAPVGVKVGADVAIDPLSWIGPGALKGLGLGKVASFLEQPVQATVGGAIGAGAAAQVAEQADAPDWVKAAAPFVGGLAGGVAGGVARPPTAAEIRAAKMGAKAGFTFPVTGVIHADQHHAERYMDVLTRHEVPWEIGDEGFIEADREVAEATAKRLSAATRVLEGDKTPGGGDAVHWIPKYGTPEYDDYMRRLEGGYDNKEGSGRSIDGRSGPSGDPDEIRAAVKDLTDMQRIYEVLQDEIVEPHIEGRRVGFKGGETVTPNDDPMAVLEAIGGVTTGKQGDKNLTTVAAALSEADAYANGLISAETSPDDLIVEIAAHIKSREFNTQIGKRGGRKNLNMTERAYRQRLIEIGDAFEASGHDAVYDPTNARSAVPEPGTLPTGPDGQGVGGESSAGGTAADSGPLPVEGVPGTAPWEWTAEHEAVLSQLDPETQQKFDELFPGRRTGAADSGESTFQDSAGTGPDSSGPIPPLDRTSARSALGLDPNGTYTPDELKQAWRAAARRYHPDVNPSATATEDMQAINAAYDELLHGNSGYDWTDAYDNPAAGAGGGAGTPPPPGGSWGGQQSTPGGSWGAQATGAGWGAKAHAPNPPPPPAGGPSFKHFAQDERFDIFKAKSRDKTMSEASAWMDSAKGKFAQTIREWVSKAGGSNFDKNLILDAKITPFIVGEKNRTANIINSWVLSVREKAQRQFEAAGLMVEQDAAGDFRIKGLGIPVEDLVDSRGRAKNAAAQAAYAALTPEQRAAVDYLEWANEAVVKTILAHNGKPTLDGDLVGEYFPRKVDSVDGTARTSGASNANRSRTMESVEEALNRNVGGKVGYGNPWEAFEAGLRGKLLEAQDAYMVESLQPLAVKGNGGTIRKGFGYDTADARPFRGPHPMAPDMLFPQDIADRIRDAYKPPSDDILRTLPAAINRFLTPLRANGDLSATLQQGMSFWLHNPVKASQAWLATVRSLKEPDAYYQAIGKLDAAGPGMEEHASWGAHWTGGSDEEMFLPKLAEKLTKGQVKEIPVLGTVARKSNEHFSRFLNLAKAEMGNDAFERATAMGLKGEALDDHMRSAWNAINRQTGWTGRKPTSIEAAFVFAPRYTSATIEQVAAAFTKGDIEGAMARRHLGKLLALTAGTAWIVNTKQGYETDFDPRSNDFLRMRNIAGLDATMAGSYDVLVRAIAGTVAGKPGEGLKPDLARPARFAEAKLAPVAKTIEELMTGETYIGEPISITNDPVKAVKEQVKSSLPFGVQNLIEEGPAAALVGTTGLSARIVSPTDKLARERDKAAGGNYEALPGEKKSVVNANPKVAAAQEKADEQALRRGGESALRVQIRRQSGDAMAANAEFLKAGKDEAGNAFSGNDYREAYHSLQAYLAGQRDTLKKFSGGDKEIDGWFALYDQAKMANHEPDRDKLDRLQAAYAADHPGILDKIDRLTGVHDDGTLREYRQAQRLARVYYAMPAYMGMSAEDSEKAQSVLGTARGLVIAGRARNQAQALAMLSKQDPKGVSAARRASGRPANPARAQFRQKNPLFGKFYSEAITLQ